MEKSTQKDFIEVSWKESSWAVFPSEYKGYSHEKTMKKWIGHFLKKEHKSSRDPEHLIY